MTQRFKNIEVLEGGSFRGSEKRVFGGKVRWCDFQANFPLFLIHEAWGKVSFEDLADGFGAGAGTMGDWSAIRDSSPEAINVMFKRALNHFFGVR